MNHDLCSPYASCRQKPQVNVTEPACMHHCLQIYNKLKAKNYHKAKGGLGNLHNTGQRTNSLPWYSNLYTNIESVNIAQRHMYI